ncbi:MAG: RNA-binding protein [Anaerolineaceae bacterium]
MNIYVGNLDYSVKNEELKDLFAEYGVVTSAQMITDRFTGKSKGFAFVEMPNDTEAQAAIAGLNGKDLKGRAINVNEARPRTEGGGGGGRRGSGGGRY